ncbi:MnmC family methyltransferase [Prochlorococcus sp. AH-716-I19]|nr:MnmC family methyltransferase [Prochlorococcus sp. AH-716-I19]
MSELKEVLTKDGSFTLRSHIFQENFHSLEGALKETEIKFINPSDLKRFNDKSLNVLDICFGLGYNSASLFNNLIRQNSFINWYALEIDKKPLKYSIGNKSFQKLWHPKVLKIFKELLKNSNYKDQSFVCDILWGDAREKIKNIPANIKFDLIYLDGFSPQKCPQVWSVEFLSKVTQKLNPQGYLITYSSSAAIRRTLKDFGLNIFNIKSNLISKNLWSNGTIAVKIIDKKAIKNNLYFKNLSSMEEEHLLTKASIPYRDPTLSSNKKDIIQKRVQEQLLSNLETSKKWRDKWGMTK